MSRLAVVIALLTLAAAPLAAQSVVPRPGDKVRLEASGISRRLTGQVDTDEVA